MDSINKQQQEENHKDLQAGEAIKKIRELCNEAKTCFFCTNIKQGEPFATRPMTVQQIDDSGDFWFLSAADSHKNAELSIISNVQMLFQADQYSGFVTLYGNAHISKDKEKIRDLWEPLMKTWFTEGVDDPRISVIQVKLTEGYYWDTKHGQMVAFVKQVAGALTGQTIDDSIEGTLKP